VADVDIEAMMVVSGHDDVVLEKDDGIYEKGDKFKKFHRQARQLMSRQALLAGFLSVWLKNVLSRLFRMTGSCQRCSSLSSSWSMDEPSDCSQRWSAVFSMGF